MIQVFMEVRITCPRNHNQLPAVLLCLWLLSHLLPSVKDKVSLSHPLPAYPLLGWVVRESFQTRVLDRQIETLKNRKQKDSFLQKIKMISAVVGAFKRPADTCNFAKRQLFIHFTLYNDYRATHIHSKTGINTNTVSPFPTTAPEVDE